MTQDRSFMREIKEGLPSWADYLIDFYLAGSITYLILQPVLGNDFEKASGISLVVGTFYATIKNIYEASKNE